MPDYTDYSNPVENIFWCSFPTVDDLIAWLMTLPPDAKLQTDATLRYRYATKTLIIQQEDA